MRRIGGILGGEENGSTTVGTMRECPLEIIWTRVVKDSTLLCFYQGRDAIIDLDAGSYTLDIVSLLGWVSLGRISIQGAWNGRRFVLFTLAMVKLLFLVYI